MIDSHHSFSINSLTTYYAERYKSLCSAASLNVFNPGTGEILGTLPIISPDHFSQICLVAQQSFHDNLNSTVLERSIALHRLSALMEEHSTALANIISLENGKPLTESHGEVAYSIGFFKWFANRVVGLQGYIPDSSPALKIEVHHRPIGVCAAITPWNFPLAMLAKKCAAALAAGCTILCKPAEETPFSAIALMRLIEQANFPKDSMHVLFGDAPDIGNFFCQSPAIRKLSFTGSTQVGQKLVAQSAPNLQKLSMELGGNAPFIVLDSANVEDVCTGMLRSKFRNSGQACISANRFIIAESRYEEMLNLLTTQATKLVVGSAFQNGSDHAIDVGPLISLKAVQKIHRLLTDAIQKGAYIHYGELPDLTSRFVHPTIITGITPQMDLWWEELFGPVIACATAKDTAEAISLANQSQHGLGAYVFTQNTKEIESVPAQIECGMVGVNTGAISFPHTPFGGVKQSGFGREGGTEGLFEYLTTQTIVRQY